MWRCQASPKSQQHGSPAQGLLDWVQQAQPSPEETIFRPRGTQCAAPRLPRSSRAPNTADMPRLPPKFPHHLSSSATLAPPVTPLEVTTVQTTGHAPSTPPNTQGKRTANYPPNIHPSSHETQGCPPPPAAYLPCPRPDECLSGPGLWDSSPPGAESQLLRIANVLWQQAGSPAAKAALAEMSTAGDQLTKRYIAATNQQGKPVHKSSKVLFQRDAESWSHPTLHFFFKIIPASSFCYFYCTIMH